MQENQLNSNLSKLAIMGKYNITGKKEKTATYRGLVSPKLMEELKDQILNIILFQQRYRDKNYSAKQLAEDLETNTRYISAVVNVKFNMNYTSFVNKFRHKHDGWFCKSSVILCIFLSNKWNDPTRI